MDPRHLIPDLNQLPLENGGVGLQDTRFRSPFWQAEWRWTELYRHARRPWKTDALGIQLVPPASVIATEALLCARAGPDRVFMFPYHPLRLEDVIERAKWGSGLTDFGDTPFRDGLQEFLRACAEEANLSLFGRFGTRWDVMRFLCNLLRLRHEELRSPEILSWPVARPLFITGLPRSGTTFLHQLLTADATNRVPRV